MREISQSQKGNYCMEYECGGLILKCLPQAHVLNTWSPAGSTILRGGVGTLGYRIPLEEVGH
jgi:hypothetical protein